MKVNGRKGMDGEKLAYLIVLFSNPASKIEMLSVKAVWIYSSGENMLFSASHSSPFPPDNIPSSDLHFYPNQRPFILFSGFLVSHSQPKVFLHSLSEFLPYLRCLALRFWVIIQNKTICAYVTFNNHYASQDYLNLLGLW